MGYLQPQASKKTHLPFVVITILLWNLLIAHNRAQQQNYKEESRISTDPSSYYYNLCAPTSCSNITLTDPFTVPSPCHPSFLKPWCANDNATLYMTSPLSNKTYRIFPTNFTAGPVTVSFVVAYDPLFTCGPISRPNFFVPVPSSTIFPVDYNLGTHLNCTRPIPVEALQGLQNASCIGCPGQDPNNVCYYAPGLVTHQNCETFTMNTQKGFNVSAEKDLRGYLQRGYVMMYTKPVECRGCEATGGRCGVNPFSSSSDSFLCFCPSAVHSFNCSDGLLVELDGGVPTKGGGSKKVVIGLGNGGIGNSDYFTSDRKVCFDEMEIKCYSNGIGLGAGLLFICMGYFYYKKRWNQNKGNFGSGEDDHEAALRCYLEGNNSIPASIETFLQNYTLGRPTRFSYKHLKKYTNNFAHKLGEGGYGSVFKGELPSGLFIAVKLLNKNNDHSEAQFLNEVRIIGQIHHNHLVRLLGYCFEHSKQQVLVYEFMEKGSLDKYIHGDDNQRSTADHKLSCNQLHQIAVGTAKGIMYLHEECGTRIVHCDIKPHNILLDRNFLPKVSDFGLALALSREKSHVSLTHGTGTPGYAPPEMWWMNCGMVSEKSDVYSFGMVMLEMLGRRRDLATTDGSSSNRIYFPKWEVNPSSGGEEPGIAERMELVALCCTQFEQSKRPSMRRVVEMLEGDVVIETPASTTIQSTTFQTFEPQLES